MKTTLVTLILSNLISLTSFSQIDNKDSIGILNTSNKFYNLVFSDMSLHPIEKWEDNKLKIDTDEYYRKLRDSKTISPTFIENEEKKFELCYEASKKVEYDKILECGCSIVFLLESRDCEFFHYINWMFTQERFSGFQVGEIKINGDTATSEIRFYYSDTTKKYFVDFTTSIYLRKYGRQWLIENIKEN